MIGNFDKGGVEKLMFALRNLMNPNVPKELQKSRLIMIKLMRKFTSNPKQTATLKSLGGDNLPRE